MGVETGGCPHTAIRENASMDLAAIEDMNRDESVNDSEDFEERLACTNTRHTGEERDQTS